MSAIRAVFPLALMACGISRYKPTDTGETGAVQSGPLRFDPLGLDFGEVAPGDTSQLQLVATNNTDANLLLASLTASGSTAFTVQLASSLPADLDPEEDVVVSVDFSPPSANSYSGTLNFQLQGIDSPSQVSLSGTSGGGATDTGGISDGGSGDGSSDGGTDGGTDDGSDGGSGGTDGGGACGLTLSTETVDFGSVDLGTVSAESLLLTNECSTAIRINDIEADSDEITFSGVALPELLNPGQSSNLTFSWQPEAVGSFSASAVISTDAEGESIHNLRLTGLAEEPPCYICDPTIAVDTGGGDSHTMSFTSFFGLADTQALVIRNESDVDLTISGYDFANDTIGAGTFSIGTFHTPLTLPAWDSVSVNITYTCAEVCLDLPNELTGENILFIYSDDPSTPTYEVNLQSI